MSSAEMIAASLADDCGANIAGDARNALYLRHMNENTIVKASTVLSTWKRGLVKG